MTVIETVPAESDARERAATLVAHGIGAEVAPGSGGFAVAVLAEEALRARQVLGIEATHEELPEGEPARSSRLLLVRVLVVGAVFVIVPLAAFWITFKLQGG